VVLRINYQCISTVTTPRYPIAFLITTEYLQTTSNQTHFPQIKVPEEMKNGDERSALMDWCS